VSDDEIIPLRPHGPATMRYGRTAPDATGHVTEAVRVAFDTDRGPFALDFTVECLAELIETLIAALALVPGERAAWARKEGKPHE